VKKTRNDIKSIFLDFWKGKGFNILDAVSVVPPAKWTDSLFINSGLIRYIDIIEKHGKLKGGWATCQPCIKHGTSHLSLEEMISKDGYFTFFEQLSCGSVDYIPLTSFVRETWNFICNIIKLSKNQIFVGVSKSQPEMVSAWIDAGLEEKNLLFPDPKAPSINLQEGYVSGYYSPIYYDRKNLGAPTCTKGDCDINCNCGRFLEIGDIGTIKNRDYLIIDHGIGLERILSVANELPRVADIKEFQQLRSAVRLFISLDTKQENILIDHLRTIVILLGEKVKPNNKGRGYILRNLLRKVFWIIAKKRNYRELFQRDEIENISDIVVAYHPIAKCRKSDIVSGFIAEEEKFNTLIKNGKKILEKTMKNKRALSREDFLFLHETHGLSAELIKFFLEDQN